MGTLHDEVTQLKALGESGKLVFPSPEADVIKSLEKVRLGEDGKVDPDTVDSSVRSLIIALKASGQIK